MTVLDRTGIHSMALNLAKQKILIVEDAREMRNSLISLTKSMGAQSVYEAKSGDEAITQLQTHAIDIVLCDYYLGPGRDGQQVFEEAKEFGMIAPHTIFIMITADNTMNVVMAVAEHSPDDYLIKPLNKFGLESRIEKVLHRKRMFKEIEAKTTEGAYGKALAICDLMAERNPKLRFDLMRMKAEILFLDGDTEGVAELCAGILMEREVAWATIFMGRVRYLAGDVVKARQLFNKAIEQNHASMEAYDWLIRVERENGDLLTAQKTLEQAVQLSPKSISRQQVLADVAVENGDHPTARKAFNAAVELGHHSCLARVEDQIGLINAVAETGGANEALEVIEALNRARVKNRSSKSDKPEWPLHLSHGQLLLASQRANEGKNSIERALSGYYEQVCDSQNPAGIALAKSCYAVGMREEGQKLVDRIIRENHDNEAVIEAVRAMFNELGMDSLGNDLIDTARRAVVEINNRGVGLAKEGELADAIELLTQASDELPGNLTIALNVLQVVFGQIKQAGYSNQRQYLLNEYLTRAARIDAQHPTFVKLKEKVESLQQARVQAVVA
ncbi:MAG: CheY-like chemotaxis protein [Gammaproteobacteria bacterium]|jgi:CheY-like chemotaxis protein